MSVMRAGDEPMHYHDGSHRWMSPNGKQDQKVWEERVREHQRRHRERLGNRPVRRPGSTGQPLRRAS
ncbi:hypothetical protein ACFFWC_28780 [Plantactinospora siamensis]|uniref:Uncharacterized protein n=1 Tax=Plantactinospora siamensis TaxID=555372 RepID=A0ABV6NZI9_9ACTN